MPYYVQTFYCLTGVLIVPYILQLSSKRRDNARLFLVIISWMAKE